MKKLLVVITLALIALLSLNFAACSDEGGGELSGIKMNKQAVTLYEGDSTTVIATAQPSLTQSVAVNYTSANESVATVDETGKITAVSVGETTITATTTDGNFSDSTSVKVMESTISFKTLTFSENTAKITLSNSVLVYDFSNEIEIKGKVPYVIYADGNFSTVVLGECQLNVGDNVFYIAHKSKIYTVTIKRLALYTATFVNGDETVSEVTVEENGFILNPSVIPSKAGYSFIGWEYDFDLPVTTNLTINAIFEPKSDVPYKIEYYCENLSGNYDLVETVNDIGVTDSVIEPEIKKYGVYVCSNPGEQGVVLADGSTVIKIYYELPTCVVTFNSGGGELVSGEETQTVKYGGTATPPVYQKYGYELVGFDLEFIEITSSINVTAIWLGIEVNYTFLVDDGVTLIGSASGVIRYGEDTQEVLAVEAQRKGYKFKGWLVNGKAIGETWSVLSETTVEITADFEVKNFDVTLDVNGGDELNNNVVNVIYGEEYLLPEPAFEGKDFICWTVKGGEPISIQGVWLFDDVVELVAVWGVNEYTLTFTQQGYSDVVIRVQNGTTYTGEIPKPKAVEGYLVKWDKTENEIKSLTSSTVITATLIPETYYVTFRLDGGEMDEDVEMEVVYGSEYTLPTPVKAGYEFAGWISSYGSVELTGVWQIADNVTLKATWK